MDFSKLAAICAAGLLLGPDRLAGAENILRFRAPGQKAAAPRDAQETSPQPPLVTVRFLSPSQAAIPDSPLDAAAAEPPLMNPLHRHALPPAPGYSDPGYPTGWFAWNNPWATYAEDMRLAHERRLARGCHSWLWWLDPKGGLFDLLGVFKHKTPGCCCSQELATTADVPDPAAMPEPAAQPPRNTVPQRSVLPRNEIPQSSRRHSPQSTAHARTPIDHRR